MGAKVMETQLTKFHGVYQWDDRNIRDERQAQSAKPAYTFMIRVRVPGGVCDLQQWPLVDQISGEHGSGTFKITTRQAFQFHDVIKRHLKPAIQDIYRALLDTLVACGDVDRSVSLADLCGHSSAQFCFQEVLCSAIPTRSKLRAQVFPFAKAISGHLIPQTTAHHEILLNKKAVDDVESLYGELYAPQKVRYPLILSVL